ncbi:MAG: carboxypeptidase regulatory-like domain-containing protein [Myxococcota bacterium]
MTALGFGPACTVPAPTNPPVRASHRGGVTFVQPRCATANSCLLGQVVTAETAIPLAQATVFLEREVAEDAAPEVVELTTLTDDQGVFAIEEPPAGRYRLQVFKRERRLEVRGLFLGEPGTTMVPVRLPQG